MPPVDDPLHVDWCARAAKLRKVEEAMLCGEMLTEGRFGEDMMRYSNASLSDVQRALNEALRNCQIARGEKPKARRRAVSGRFRPY